MKKIEAQAISAERSRLIIEYITKILSDTEKVNASMNFSSVKIDNQMMCTLDIYVPQRNFEKHLNLGITTDHDLILYEQLLNDLLNTFLEHETMGVSRYYSIKSMQENFSGINAVNSIGSKIKINLNSSGVDFNELMKKYNQRINEYADSLNKQDDGKLNINISDIVLLSEQIDYSLLLNIINPIIIYYIADKSFKKYKLHKDFKSKTMATIDLPPEIIRKHSEIDKERLLRQKFGESIINFVTTIIDKIPNANLTLLYNNLSSLTTSTKNYKIYKLLFGSNTEGSYIVRDNNIKLSESNYNLTIDHELFHVSSTFYRKEDGMVFSGFNQQLGKKNIGVGINEGYTQLLTERYFGESKEVMLGYKYEKNIAESLEMIIGKEKMESLYFSANLYRLVQELIQYENENTIMQFINDLDFLSNHLSETHLPSEKNMFTSKLKNVYRFLLSCYIKKIKSDFDNGILSNEQLNGNLSTFLDNMGTRVRIGNTRYVFTDTDETLSIMKTALDNLKNDGNDFEYNLSQSPLKGK